MAVAGAADADSHPARVTRYHTADSGPSMGISGPSRPGRACDSQQHDLRPGRANCETGRTKGRDIRESGCVEGLCAQHRSYAAPVEPNTGALWHSTSRFSCGTMLGTVTRERGGSSPVVGNGL